MTNKELCEIFKIEDIMYLPDAISNILFSDEKDVVFNKLLALGMPLSFDWFQVVYEDELAQRNQSKQDFTPNSVGILLSKLTGSKAGYIHEPTAGNGSLIIANWWYRKNNVADFKESEHPIDCWELSSRSIPILLLNLSIRGIEGTVRHGNVLTKELKTAYKLAKNSDFRFSSIEII